MKHVNILIMAAVMLSLLCCATPYQPAGGVRGGYSDGKVDNNTFWVMFNGNGYISAEKAYNYCIKRAAEVTIENGYSYFAVIEHNSKIFRHQGTYSKIDSRGLYAGEANLPWISKKPRVKITFDVFRSRPDMKDGREDVYIDAKKFLTK